MEGTLRNESALVTLMDWLMCKRVATQFVDEVLVTIANDVEIDEGR